MHRAALALLTACLVAGCAEPAPVIAVNDGYLHVPGNGTFECGGRPASIDGSHKDVTVQGHCKTIRVAGSHVDVVAYVDPGATIDVTGSHDTIVYRLTRRGPPPRWVDKGEGNELLRNSRFAEQQDHDWFQERQ